MTRIKSIKIPLVRSRSDLCIAVIVWRALRGFFFSRNERGGFGIDCAGRRIIAQPLPS